MEQGWIHRARCGAAVITVPLLCFVLAAGTVVLRGQVYRSSFRLHRVSSPIGSRASGRWFRLTAAEQKCVLPAAAQTVSQVCISKRNGCFSCLYSHTTDKACSFTGGQCSNIPNCVFFKNSLHLSGLHRSLAAPGRTARQTLSMLFAWGCFGPLPFCRFGRHCIVRNSRLPLLRAGGQHWSHGVHVLCFGKNNSFCSSLHLEA